MTEQSVEIRDGLGLSILIVGLAEVSGGDLKGSYIWEKFLFFLADIPGRTLSYHLVIGDSYLHQNTKDLVVSQGYSSIFYTISYKYFELILEELNGVLAHWSLCVHLNSVQKQLVY